MASASKSDEEIASESESDVTDESDDDESSEDDSDYQTEPCKYYNGTGCRDGDGCPYLHVCKYALKGNCRYGASCKLNHPERGGASSGARNRSADQPEIDDPKLTDGRFYQWQLNSGKSWMDISNDHVIEAQYSLPHTRSMKIYNTPYGAVDIDFNRMRVIGKSLRVRRLDDGCTVWLWYCTLRRTWKKYGDKDSKGNPGPVQSSEIEKKFQSNPKGCFTFSVRGETFEIRFKEMRQVGKRRRRKVTRRPLYREKLTAAGVSAALQNLSVGSKVRWQFEGDSGAWHEYKQKNECSVNSDDIERKYQQNPTGSMVFKVKGHAYKLDFGAMKQLNLGTKRSRKIRRVLV